MPLPATSQAPADVISGHDPQRGVRWSPPHVLSGAWVRLLVGLVLVALVSTVALRVIQEQGRTGVVHASGSMLFEVQLPEGAGRPENAQTTGEGHRSGSIRVELPDRQMVGSAQLSFSFALRMDDHITRFFHDWGEVRASFGAVTCHGPFAWSYYREPHETQGSINLRCDDGSALAATALVDKDEDWGAGHHHRTLVTLQDGWYVAG